MAAPCEAVLALSRETPPVHVCQCLPLLPTDVTPWGGREAAREPWALGWACGRRRGFVGSLEKHFAKVVSEG